MKTKKQKLSSQALYLAMLVNDGLKHLTNGLVWDIHPESMLHTEMKKFNELLNYKEEFVIFKIATGETYGLSTELIKNHFDSWLASKQIDYPDFKNWEEFDARIHFHKHCKGVFKKSDFVLLQTDEEERFSDMISMAQTFMERQ